MKQKQDSNTEQGHRANTLLYAVAPNPKLSTDAIALDGAVVSRGNGIGATSEVYLMDCIVGMKHYPDKYFDLAVVDPPYGINHFIEHLKSSKGWIFWDKLNGEISIFSHGEIIFTSFDKKVQKIEMRAARGDNDRKDRIHPTQKPKPLYDWIFKNYSEPGQKIIDTHLGSGSSRISAHKYGLNFTGFEIDEEYYYAQEKRFTEYQKQINLFN